MVPARVLLFAAFRLASSTSFADLDALEHDYRADGDCPPEATFRREVLSRAPSVRFAPHASDIMLVRLQASSGAEPASGFIMIVRRGEPGQARNVSGSSCE